MVNVCRIRDHSYISEMYNANHATMHLPCSIQTQQIYKLITSTDTIIVYEKHLKDNNMAYNLSTWPEPYSRHSQDLDPNNKMNHNDIFMYFIGMSITYF